MGISFGGNACASYQMTSQIYRLIRVSNTRYENAEPRFKNKRKLCHQSTKIMHGDSLFTLHLLTQWTYVMELNWCLRKQNNHPECVGDVLSFVLVNKWNSLLEKSKALLEMGISSKKYHHRYNEISAVHSDKWGKSATNVLFSSNENMTQMYPTSACNFWWSFHQCFIHV